MRTGRRELMTELVSLRFGSEWKGWRYQVIGPFLLRSTGYLRERFLFLYVSAGAGGVFSSSSINIKRGVDREPFSRWLTMSCPSTQIRARTSGTAVSSIRGTRAQPLARRRSSRPPTDEAISTQGQHSKCRVPRESFPNIGDVDSGRHMS